MKGKMIAAFMAGVLVAAGVSAFAEDGQSYFVLERIYTKLMSIDNTLSEIRTQLMVKP